MSWPQASTPLPHTMPTDLFPHAPTLPPTTQPPPPTRTHLQWAEFFGACSWRVLGSPYYGDVAKEWRVALSQARRGKGATQDMDTAAHVGYVTAVLQG